MENTSTGYGSLVQKQIANQESQNLPLLHFIFVEKQTWEDLRAFWVWLSFEWVHVLTTQALGFSLILACVDIYFILIVIITVKYTSTVFQLVVEKVDIHVFYCINTACT